jgi:hypothetical protein
LISQELLQQFQQDRFELDLHSVIVSNSYMQASYTGPGFLRRTDTGAISLKFFLTKLRTEVLSDLTTLNYDVSPGEIFLQKNLFSCNATDLSGNQWSTDSIILTPQVSFITNSGTIQFTVNKFECSEAIQPQRATKLYLTFHNQTKSNWIVFLNTVQEIVLKAPEFSFSFEIVTDVEGQISIVISSTSDFPPSFQQRFVESMEFTLGLNLDVVFAIQMDTKLRTVQLYSSSNRNTRLSSFPPLPNSTIRFRLDCLKVLKSYLEYIYTQPTAGMLHPCSVHVAHARQASANSFDAWTVGVSVAAEGIARLLPSTGSPVQKAIKEIQKIVRMWVKKKKFDESVQARVNGCLGSLSQVRPIDRMMELVKSGYLDENDVNAWKSLRNISVHTSDVREENLNAENLQLSLNDLHRIYKLIHTMIFFLIGYEGQYTNYSKQGYPVERFPAASGPQV